MFTTADEKRREAMVHVDAAVKALSEIVVGRCSGYDGYTETYQRKLKDSMNALIDVRSGL